MPEVRNNIVAQLWRGRDPFANFPRNLYEVDMQGWGSSHSYFDEEILRYPDPIILEVGVWKGGSTIYMANLIKEKGDNGAVISVDTWLGAVDHWISQYFDDIGHLFGQPTIMRKFMNNVVQSKTEDYVVPLPLDSLNAAELIKIAGIRPHIIHIDAGHEYSSVMSDLQSWWPLLAEGGVLIGDDYYPEQHWPGVKRAFHEFFKISDRNPIEFINGKCRIRKS